MYFLRIYHFVIESSFKLLELHHLVSPLVALLLTLIAGLSRPTDQSPLVQMKMSHTRNCPVRVSSISFPVDVE